MPTTAENLRDLHALHQRAKATRDRLTSGPKTIAARKAALEKQQADLEAASATLKKTKADAMSRENQAQAIRDRVDELHGKLNLTRKQTEYEAIRNQIAHDNLAADKLEDEAIELLTRAEELEVELKAQKAEVTNLQTNLETLISDIETRSESDQVKLSELESAIVGAEAIIPTEARDQYRRVIKSRGAEGMAAVEQGACTGCYMTITAQMLSDLINGEILVFCKSCGRVLYLEESQAQAVRH